jgi:hypothetical protein
VVPYGPSVELAKKVKCKLTLFNKGNHGLGKRLFNSWFFFRKIKRWLS